MGNKIWYIVARKLSGPKMVESQELIQAFSKFGHIGAALCHTIVVCIYIRIFVYQRDRVSVVCHTVGPMAH